MSTMNLRRAHTLIFVAGFGATFAGSLPVAAEPVVGIRVKIGAPPASLAAASGPSTPAPAPPALPLLLPPASEPEPTVEPAFTPLPEPATEATRAPLLRDPLPPRLSAPPPGSQVRLLSSPTFTAADGSLRCRRWRVEGTTVANDYWDFLTCIDPSGRTWSLRSDDLPVLVEVDEKGVVRGRTAPTSPTAGPGTARAP